MNDDARPPAELRRGELPDRGRGGGAVAGEGGGGIPRGAQEEGVNGQAIRDPPEAAERLEPLDHSSLDRVARALDLRLLRTVAAKRLELRVKGALDLLDGVTRPRRDFDVEHRPEHERVLLRDDALGDLLL